MNCSDDYLEALLPDIARRGQVLRFVWYRQKEGAAAGSAADGEGGADVDADDLFEDAGISPDAPLDVMEALVARERSRSFFYLSWDADAHLATVDANGSVAFTVQKKDFGRFVCEVHRIAPNGKAEKFHEIDFVLEDRGI